MVSSIFTRPDVNATRKTFSRLLKIYPKPNLTRKKRTFRPETLMDMSPHSSLETQSFIKETATNQDLTCRSCSPKTFLNNLAHIPQNETDQCMDVCCSDPVIYLRSPEDVKNIRTTSSDPLFQASSRPDTIKKHCNGLKKHGEELSESLVSSTIKPIEPFHEHSVSSSDSNRNNLRKFAIMKQRRFPTAVSLPTMQPIVKPFLERRSSESTVSAGEECAFCSGEPTFLSSQDSPSPSTEIVKERRSSESTVSAGEECAFCSGEPTFLSSQDSPSPSTEIVKDSTLTIEAGSSSGVNGCCNNILATTVTFADDKVSVRYWPPVVINNETRISASSTTWRKELFSDSAEHEIEVPPCDDGKKQKLNDVDEQTTDTNSRCHINGISEENEVANGSDSCSGSPELEWESSGGKSSPGGLFLVTPQSSCDPVEVAEIENSAMLDPTFFEECLALDPARSNSDLFNHHVVNQTGLQRASLVEVDSSISESETSHSSDESFSERSSLIEKLKNLEEALNRNTQRKSELKSQPHLLSSEKTDNRNATESQDSNEGAKATKKSILKIHQTLKISAEHHKSNKSVRFLDSAGMPLVKVKQFDEAQELLDKIKSEESKLSASLSKKSGQEIKPLFKCAFDQPAADYLKFRQCLDQKFVSLENVDIQGSRLISGTIKVKNICFEKKVFVRITFNSWNSSSDIVCAYIPSGSAGASIYDTFRFQAEIPMSWYDHHRIEFCVCFAHDGLEHWDSNNGVNYSIVSSRTNVSVLASPTNHEPVDPNSTLFSYWRANTLLDQGHPYW